MACVTKDQLDYIMPLASVRVPVFLNPLNDAMAEFQINTPARQAAFLAQISHESGELRFVQEIASGSAYEGRKDLGNTQPGDGVRFKGRGLIQITGRANYLSCGTGLGVDLINHPELLETPALACLSAAWFWKTRGLNLLADQDTDDAFEKITRRINGGLTGMDSRMNYWDRACDVLGDD